MFNSWAPDAVTSDLSHSPSCWRAASWVCAGLWSQQTPAESWSEGGLSWPLKSHNPPKRCDSGNSTDGHSYRRHRYSTRSSTLQATYSSAVAAKTEVSTLGPASRCDPAALRVRALWPRLLVVCFSPSSSWCFKTTCENKGGIWGPAFAPWHVYLSEVTYF